MVASYCDVGCIDDGVYPCKLFIQAVEHVAKPAFDHPRWVIMIKIEQEFLVYKVLGAA
jgi:hypothetical protein